MPHARIGIVGGGVLGLTLALRLSAAGHRVAVYEAGDQPGGLATWFDYGEFVWDKYYHVVNPRDSDLVALIEELGLGSDLVWRQTRMGFLWQNRLVSMSSHVEFLTFPALSLWEKFRLGLGVLYTARKKDVSRLEQLAAGEWMRRVFGQRVTEVMWVPLLESKFGTLANQVPASFMVAIIQRVLGSRSSHRGAERLGYLRGGYRSFLNRLLDRIREQGGHVQVGVRVEAIEAGLRGGAALRTSQGVEEFDRVISTVPAPLFRQLVAALPDLPGEAGGKPAFLGVICLALVLRQPLSPYYVTNLIQRGLPFTGIIEYTAVADSESEMAGYHLVYLPRYETPDSPCFALSNAEITERCLEALEKIWPDIRTRVVRTFVNREPLVQALWLPGTRQPTEPLRSRQVPVESITAELVGLDTLNNNAIIRLANAQAARVVGELS